MDGGSSLSRQWSSQFFTAGYGTTSFIPLGCNTWDIHRRYGCGVQHRGVQHRIRFCSTSHQTKINASILNDMHTFLRPLAKEGKTCLYWMPPCRWYSCSLHSFICVCTFFFFRSSCPLVARPAVRSATASSFHTSAACCEYHLHRVLCTWQTSEQFSSLACFTTIFKYTSWRLVGLGLGTACGLSWLWSQLTCRNSSTN